MKSHGCSLRAMMHAYQIFFSNKLIIMLSCFFVSVHLTAEPPFTWVQGSSAITKEKHLAFINGMVWAEKRIAEIMYRYGNPDDALIKLIKELLYLQADNVSFRPTILKSKPASYWTTRDIGMMMYAIAVYRHSNAPVKEKDAQLIAALERVMQSSREKMQHEQKNMAVRIAEIKEQTKGIAEENKALTAQIRQAQRIDPVAQDEIEEKVATLDQLEESQKFLSGKKEVLEDESKKLIYVSKAIERALQSGITELIGYIVQSLKESAPDATQKYVSYATEQILLTFLWKIANPRQGAVPKQDLVDYFDALGDLVDAHNLKVWINAAPYSKKDYESFSNDLKTMCVEQLGLFMTHHYEHTLLVIKGYGVWQSPLPPIITGARVTYTHPGGKATTSFSDCVETSFRNFFNIILYNPITNVFDIQQLVNADSQQDEIPVQLKAQLINFYQTNPSVINVQAIELYNAWTQVVEDLPGVVYIEPQAATQKDRFYEVKSSLPNMLKICNHLFFGNNPLFNQLSRKEQLDLICVTLSREGFVLTWQIMDQSVKEDELDKHDYVTLQFWINDETPFEWELRDGHSVIPQLKNIGYPMSKIMVEQLKPDVETAMPLSVEAYNLMAMAISNEEFNLVTMVNYPFLDPLDESSDRLDTIERMMSTSDVSRQAIVKQLILSLAQAEFNRYQVESCVQLIWKILKDPTSPFYAEAQDAFKNMRNESVSGMLISKVIVTRSDYLYDIAKQKFATLANDNQRSSVVHAIIVKKFEAWYGIGKQMFEAMTDEADLSFIIQTIINNKFEAWYDLAKQKLQIIKNAQPLGRVIEAIINNKFEVWYDWAKQMFEAMGDGAGLGIVIQAIINNKFEAWYDIALQKFASIESNFTLVALIQAIINNKFEAWYGIAQRKFVQIDDYGDVRNIADAVITNQAEAWYGITLKRAQEMGLSKKVTQLEQLQEEACAAAEGQ